MKDVISTMSCIWGSFIAFVAAMNSDQWLFAIGVAGTALSISITWIYKHKEFKVIQKHYENKGSKS